MTRALLEDLAGGVDVTSVATVPVDQESTADFARPEPGWSPGCGRRRGVRGVGRRRVEVSDRLAEDGGRVQRGDVLMSVTGPTRGLLTAERTALNLLCRMSGVAHCHPCLG